MHNDLWQAMTTASPESIRASYPEAEPVDWDLGIWLVPVPVSVAEQLDLFGYAEWEDRNGIHWEAETP